MGEMTRVALAVARKDLRVELRTRSTLLAAVVFGALILVVFNFSRDPTAIADQVIGPSALWVAVAFSSVVALNRAFTLERENAAMDALRLSPAPRGALFLGKFLANLVFVLFVVLVTVPLAMLFFDLPVEVAGWGLVLLLLLASINRDRIGLARFRQGGERASLRQRRH